MKRDILVRKLDIFFSLQINDFYQLNKAINVQLRSCLRGIKFWDNDYNVKLNYCVKIALCMLLIGPEQNSIVRVLYIKRRTFSFDISLLDASEEEEFTLHR